MELNDKQIQILTVAEKLFAKNGFDGTSVRQIAKEADINIAMISYYFGSKEKLLEALFFYRISDFRMELETIIHKNITHLEKLHNIVALIVKRVHKNRRTHKIMNFEYSNSSRKLDFDSYVQQKTENFKVIEAFVKDGQKQGIFSKNVNIKLLTPTILGTYFHFYYNKRFYQNFLHLKDDTDTEHYVHNELTNHIQQIIKALLTHEK
jgi:AcrR family transcriptional regulator